MQLQVLTKVDCEQVRLWRNENIAIWRTPYFLTESMQADWYEKDVCNRDSKNRWWGVQIDDTKSRSKNYIFNEDKLFVGMVGLVGMSLENRNAEFTIIIDPKLSRKGYGTKALLQLLDKGFNELNLENIYSEAYTCNPNIEFWNKILERTGAYKTYLPDRKYWQSAYYQSLYFNFTKKDFKNYVRSLQ
jgi:RimJ/RimL family protein N-acetyltransferase